MTNYIEPINNEEEPGTELEVRNNNTFDIRQAEITKLLLEQNQYLNNEIMQLKSNIAKQEDIQLKQDKKIVLLEEESKSTRQFEISRHMIEDNSFEYVGLAILGQQFNVTIGAKTMGKFLKVIGLAKVSKQTTPLRVAINERYAEVRWIEDSNYGVKRKNYVWNPERVVLKVQRWLESKGLLENFLNITDAKELHQFINELYEIYC